MPIASSSWHSRSSKLPIVTPADPRGHCCLSQARGSGPGTLTPSPRPELLVSCPDPGGAGNEPTPPDLTGVAGSGTGMAPPTKATGAEVGGGGRPEPPVPPLRYGGARKSGEDRPGPGSNLGISNDGPSGELWGSGEAFCRPLPEPRRVRGEAPGYDGDGDDRPAPSSAPWGS
jgi:hypothetical protein